LNYNGRIINEDKHIVLINLLNINDNTYPSNIYIKELEKKVIDQGIKSLTQLKLLYTLQKQQRMNGYYSHYQETIDTLNQELIHLNY
jgi:hypothetical protein